MDLGGFGSWQRFENNRSESLNGIIEYKKEKWKDLMITLRDIWEKTDFCKIMFVTSQR